MAKDGGRGGVNIKEGDGDDRENGRKTLERKIEWNKIEKSPVNGMERKINNGGLKNTGSY